MSEDEHDDFPDEFSDATCAALREAAVSLLQVLQDHVDALSVMDADTADVEHVHALNAALERHVDAYNERVFDHTGTVALALDAVEGVDLEAVDDADEVDGRADGTPLAVVSRWDLVVTDAEALRRAGRHAHQRSSGESQEAAAVSVSSVGAALHALLHEHGEPWYDLPGIDVSHGVRKIIHAEGPVEIEPDEDVDAPITEPAGRCLHGESWVHV